MSRVAYVNGRYLPHNAASVHIEDRGYQFADGVYEVIAVERGLMVDEGLHLKRLSRSLRELEIAEPMQERALKTVMREVIRRNRVDDGIIYIQMTRGVAPRDHAFPKHATTQVVMTARRSRPHNPKTTEEGVSVITIPDIRWARCDIKSVSLLPNVLGKQRAREAGAYEAWQVDRDGMVTEGTSTNAWIVTKAGEVITREAGDPERRHPTGRPPPDRERRFAARRTHLQRRRSQGRARGFSDQHHLGGNAGRAARRRADRRRKAGPDGTQVAAGL